MLAGRGAVCGTRWGRGAGAGVSGLDATLLLIALDQSLNLRVTQSTCQQPQCLSVSPLCLALKLTRAGAA